MVKDALEYMEDTVNVGIASVQTFQEAGVLTQNKGLVVRLQDGKEFQINIVQSR
jgi:hypothetical protein